MDTLPVVLVSIDQGIPFLSKQYSFLFTENDPFWDYINSNNNTFLICLTTKENSSITDEDIKYAGPIGYICRYIEKSSMFLDDEEKDGLHEIVCMPYEYIEFKKIQKNQTLNILEGEYKIAEIKNTIKDLDLIEDLKEFLLFVCSNIKTYPLHSIENLKSLKDGDIMDLCDEIACSFYSDNFDKYIYIQCDTDIDRVRNITTYILNLNNDFISMNLKEYAIMGHINRGKKTKSLFEKPPSRPKTPPRSYKEFPKEVSVILKKERKKLDRLPQSSLEYQAVLTYIETLETVPWKVNSPNNYDLGELVEKINLTHYGLQEIKQHVLEHIVLENHLNENLGTVLCFVGPPGTGKTSIAKTIATATNREIVKIALGGVSDEAEIRGHRRTYVAAKQGRIIDGLIKAKTMNPIVVLDEVDKLDKGTRGDPTSALLELLDPEQNDQFVDRFIEIPVDLSKCMFICTANYKEQIPPALYDRLEIVKFKEYKKEERYKILKDFIFPTILVKYKMDNFKITTTEEFYDKFSEEKSIRKIEKNVSKILKTILAKFIIKKIQSYTLTKETFDLINSDDSENNTIGFNR
jgi:ATP-dependent Lon protease